jgi:PAS domain S-box-containing protein
MLGYREEELLGRTVLDITPPEWIPVAARQFATFAQMSGQGRTHDVALQRRDGGVFFADITSNPIVYRGQRCLLGIIRDITERKQALEAVQREQAILQKLLAAEDRERQLVSYEIHDGLVQFLMAARLHFEAYDQRLRERREDARDAYASGRALLQESLTEGRRLVGTLRTPAPDPRGVVAMLEAYLSDQQQYDGLQCEFHTLGSFTGLDAAIENALVRIVQEGVTNVRRHSRSEKVRVEVTAIDGRVRLEIRDWGVGFQPEQLSAGGFGLEGIRARARLLGGTVQIESTPGQGTQILVELPFCPA